MGTSENQVERIWIPDISNERLEELAKRIRPTYRFSDGLRYIVPVDLRRTAYTWSPKPADKTKSLQMVADIRTYHSYGAPSFFKPSVAEVLSQIPSEYLEQVVAFEIIDAPQDVDDLNEEREALNAGYHVATTRLYRSI